MMELGFAGLLTLMVLACLYFFPTMIAFVMEKRNRFAILALNLFLGWTLLGWVVSLVWALTTDREV